MICSSIRNQIAQHFDVQCLSSRMAAHLDECASCQSWHDDLVALEREIPEVPIPRSTRKESFLQDIRAGKFAEQTKPAPKSEPEIVPAPRASSWGMTNKERGLRKLSLAMAITAAMLLFVFGWWMFPSSTPPTPKPTETTHAQQLRSHRQGLLASAKTPRDRVNVLAKFAGELQEQARRADRSDDPNRLKVISQCFAEVVRRDLIYHSRTLSAEERKEVLDPVLTQLRRTNSEIEHLIAMGSPNPTMLREIADAARISHQQLTALL